MTTCWTTQRVVGVDQNDHHGRFGDEKNVVLNRTTFGDKVNYGLTGFSCLMLGNLLPHYGAIIPWQQLTVRDRHGLLAPLAGN